MREYTAKQIKELKANPYTLKVTKNKLYFTIKFKEDFWTSYQAGNALEKSLKILGIIRNILNKSKLIVAYKE
ncbi:MAG: HTH domain-containing protein [Mediterraneibacter faecis]